jgi:hydrogenase maturation protease
MEQRDMADDGGAPRILVIGVGNLSRGDDGLGILAARRLARSAPPGVVVREASGEGTGLLAMWEGEERVVLLDAVRTGSPPGTVVRVDAVRERVPPDWCRCSSHLFGVGEAIELARVTGRLPGSLVVYGIEGERFGFGEPLSPAVEAALAELEQRVRDACG